MSQPRLYLDEDSMGGALVFGLRARSVDVLSASEADMINRDDEDHLVLAAAGNRVLYTFNVADFCILHQAWVSEGRQHAGIIVAPQQRYTVGEELRRLVRLIDSLSAEEMRNLVEFLSAWN